MFAKNTNFWIKTEILVKNTNFWIQIEILVKNYGQKFSRNFLNKNRFSNHMRINIFSNW